MAKGKSPKDEKKGMKKKGVSKSKGPSKKLFDKDDNITKKKK